MGAMQKHHFNHVLSRHSDYACDVYIETGLYRGDRLVVAAECFKVLHGIELDPNWYRVSKERVARFPHITLHHGDTRELLPTLIEKYAQTQCFFYLDAHYCETNPPIQKSAFPLWDELGKIRNRKTKDIVVVDDIHTFGVQRPELRFTPDAVEWEGVTVKSLLKYFGNQVRDSLRIADSFVIWREGESDT